MVRSDFLLSGAALLATALTVTTAMADPIERYAELQAVGEAINDPDPLMRLALLEEIIEKGDATEVQLAIRTAFSIDDPNIRSLGLRTHFASFRNLTVTAEYPAEIQAVLDGEKEAEIKAVRDAYKAQFDFMESLGQVFKFSVEYSDPSDLEFAVYSLNRNPQKVESPTGAGNIRGALITLQSAIKLSASYSHVWYRCTFEFSEYVGFTVKGIGSCDYNKTLPFPVTLHLFEPDEG